MKIRNISFSLLLLSTIITSGCGTSAFKMRDANDQLTTYYMAKKTADEPMVLESVIASLENLAISADEQAQKEKDVRNQIAFYRIAVTASWQAEDGKALAYSNKGKVICDESNNIAPRDCGMIKIFPIYASIDEISDFYNLTLKEVNQNPGNESTYLNDVLTIFEDYIVRLKDLYKDRKNVVVTGVNPEFIKVYDEQIDDVLCDKVDDKVRGLLVTTSGDNMVLDPNDGLLIKISDGELNYVDKRISKLKNNAKSIGLNNSDLSCLSSS